MIHSPENDADELNRIARIMEMDASGKQFPLEDHERSEHLQRLDELLQSSCRATIACINDATRKYLEGYTEGIVEYNEVRELLGRYES